MYVFTRVKQYFYFGGIATKGVDVMSKELKTLGLQGFKQRELHTVIWALREFADAAGIEIHNGIKERYDAERKTYGISFRFYKESNEESLFTADVAAKKLFRVLGWTNKGE